MVKSKPNLKVPLTCSFYFNFFCFLLHNDNIMVCNLTLVILQYETFPIFSIIRIKLYGHHFRHILARNKGILYITLLLFVVFTLMKLWQGLSWFYGTYKIQSSMTLSAYIIDLKQKFSTDTVILSKIIVILKWMATFDFYSINVRKGFAVELLKMVRCMQKLVSLNKYRQKRTF